MLKKIKKKISQLMKIEPTKKTATTQSKDKCILLISGFIRDNCERYIIDELQQVIFIFYYNPINSNILNDNERSILLDMITKHRNIQSEYKLIYRATRDGCTRKAFYNKLQTQKPSLHIIETSDGDVFGAFVSITIPSLARNYDLYADDKAFLYTIRSSNNDFMDRKIPRIFPIKKDKINAAVGVQSGFWLMFGTTAGELFLSDQHFISRNGIYSGGGTYDGIPKDKWYLTSGNDSIKINEIETFILK